VAECFRSCSHDREGATVAQSPERARLPLRPSSQPSDLAPVRARRALIILALGAGVGAGAARAEARTALFYYPWYGTQARDGSYLHCRQHWRLPPFDIASNFYPLRGAYSSGDPRVVAAQMGEIADAGIDAVVISWWGWGSLEDARLPAVIAGARANGLRVAAHIEPY